MSSHKNEIPLLVNRDRPLPDDYAVHLVEIDGYPGMQCDRQCAQAIAQFLAASMAAGFHPTILSAYRDRKTQKCCFAAKVDKFWGQGTTLEQALTAAARIVAAPGMSEHQTGLAFDIRDDDYKDEDTELDESPGQKWLMDHCYEYGFILRYPPDKEPITHVDFEPCHYRYVGVEHAAAIVEQGITLEEYLALLEQK